MLSIKPAQSNGASRKSLWHNGFRLMPRRGFSSHCANMPPACLLPALFPRAARAKPEFVSNPLRHDKRPPRGWSFVMVPRRGFEPRTPCLKGRCSTY